MSARRSESNNRNNAWTKIANLKFVRFYNIQTRLTVFMIGIVLLSVSITGLVSFKQSSSAINGKIELYSNQMIDQIGSGIDLEMKHIQFVLEDIASSDSVQSGLTELHAAGDQAYVITNEINKEIAHKLSLLNYLSSINIYVNDRLTLGTYNSLNKEQFQSVIRETRQDFEFHHFLIDDPMRDKSYISISRSIKHAVDGAALGAIVVTLEERHIASLYADLDLGPGAEIVIVDPQGSVVSSRNHTKYPINSPLIQENLAALIQHHATQEPGSYISTLDETKSLVSVTAMSSNNWKAVSVIPLAFLHAEIYSLRNLTMLIGGGCLFISAFIAFFISLGVSVPGKQLIRIMNRVNEGYLNIRMESNHRDEMGAIAANFQTMMGTISRLIGSVEACSKRLLEQAHTIAAMSERFRASHLQFAASIEQIAQGAGNQAVEAVSGASNMADLADRISDTGDDISSISCAIEKIAAVVEHTEQVIDNLNDKSEVVRQATQTVNRDIISLNQQLQTVAQIVQSIGAIAKKTNILALNASIEAARAGSSGKGFAVIADEVKQLANQSRLWTEEIYSIVAIAGEQSESNVLEGDKAIATLEELGAVITNTEKQFEQIKEATDLVLEHIGLVKQTSQAMLAAKSNTSQAIESISSVAQETAAVTEQALSNAHEQSEAIDQLAQLAMNIRDTSRELAEAIAHFKTH